MASFPLSAQPRWQPWEQQHRGEIPRQVCSWLEDDRSLTRRIQLACGAGFRVRLLQQRWGSPDHAERQLLHMRRGGIAMVREVELRCAEVPWVFARTLIPVRSLRGAARQLVHLGDKPLGAVLFSMRGIRRDRIEVAHLLPTHALFVAATSNLQTLPEDLWARRTRFFFSGRPLLVNEIFLPALEQPTAEQE